MNIKTIRTSDTISLANGKINMIIDDNEVSCKVDLIDKISIITTDQGPLIDDVAIAIAWDENVLIIPSEHPEFQDFLFSQISEIIPIDFEIVIKAMSSTDNAEFVLFTK